MNPFGGYGAIVTGERFVGRRTELEFLRQRLSEACGSLSVIGEPRVGKSSLVNAAADRVRALNAKTPVVWLDVSTLPSSVELFSGILSEILAECERRSISLPPDIARYASLAPGSSYEAYRNCRLALLSLKRVGIEQLVVLDEFDAVRKLDDAATTIQRIRDLIYRRFETGLGGVFISRRSLRSIEQQVADVSTLDNVCEQYCVRPFDHTRLEEMLRRCADTWEPGDADRDLLWWYTGGHPYLAEMILCHSYPHKSVEKGAEAVVASIFEFYQHLQRILEEDELFEQLLQIVVGPRWSVKAGSSEIALRYGLIRRVEEGMHHRYAAWSSHFELFLEKCAREGSIWELWREAECAVRDFIGDACVGAYGDDWLKVLSKRHRPIADAAAACQRRMLQEQQHFGAAAAGGLLDYSYPMDLWCVISCEWDLFRNQLLREKRYWAERFSHLAKIRTPTAHNREAIIPDHEIALAHAYCKELLAAIRRRDEALFEASAPAAYPSGGPAS